MTEPNVVLTIHALELRARKHEELAARYREVAGVLARSWRLTEEQSALLSIYLETTDKRQPSPNEDG